MAKFFVGQRVRIVCDDFDARCVGREGVVNELDCGNYETDSENGFVGVTIPGLCPTPDRGYRWNEDDWSYPPEWLEPITPPKQQEVISWEEAPFTRDGRWKVGVAA